MGGDVGKNFEEIGWGGDKDGGGRSDGDNGWQVDDKWGEEGGWADGWVREDGDGEQGGRVTIGTWVIPSIVGVIKEVLNNLVGGSDVDLINVVNL